jgi:hypothetical protein
MQDNTARTDLGAAADLDVAEHFCPSAQAETASNSFLPQGLASEWRPDRRSPRRGLQVRSLAGCGSLIPKRRDCLGHPALQEMRKLSPTIAPQPMADALPLQRVEALVVRAAPGHGRRGARPDRRLVALLDRTQDQAGGLETVRKR